MSACNPKFAQKVLMGMDLVRFNRMHARYGVMSSDEALNRSEDATACKLACESMLHTTQGANDHMFFSNKALELLHYALLIEKLEKSGFKP